MTAVSQESGSSEAREASPIPHPIDAGHSRSCRYRWQIPLPILTLFLEAVSPSFSRWHFTQRTLDIVKINLIPGNPALPW